MKRPRLLALATALVVATGLAAVAAAAGWLFYTPSGLAWTAARASALVPGLRLDGVSGTLAGGATVSEFGYAGTEIDVRVAQARFRVSAFSLIEAAPRISAVRAAEVVVIMKPGDPAKEPPETLALPFRVRVTDVQITRLTIGEGKDEFVVTDLRLDYAGGKREHQVHELRLAVPGHTLMLRGTMGASRPYPLKASASLVRADAPAGRLDALVTGELARLALDLSASVAAGRLAAKVSLEPYAAQPVEQVSAQLSGVDLGTFIAQLPRTALSGTADLSRSTRGLAGTIELANTLSGPYDKGRLPFTGLRAQIDASMADARLTGMSAELGDAGTLTGSGRVDRSGAKLALATKALNLAGLHTRLHATRLAGRADLALSAARQSIEAEFAQDWLALKLTANRTGDAVEIPQFRARSRGGEASGQARLHLTGKQPFSLEATLLRFDPAAWGAFPGGSLNGTIAARGTIAGPAADARFVIRDSRLLDAPLAGKGVLSLTPERVHGADFELTLGGNSLSARGALGARNDTIALRFDAPRPALFDANLQGHARGTAEVSGSWRAPSVRFRVAATQLAYKGLGRVKSLEAKGTLGARDESPLEVDAVLQGLVSAQGDLSSAAVKIEGTRNAHTALVKALGHRIDLQARARGSWRAAEGWAGTLSELANRGDIPLELAAPVQIWAGPQRVRAGRFELRALGGEVMVSALDYDRGRLTTTGRFTALALGPVVALAGGPREAAGSLRLGGNWSIQAAPRLAGKIAIARESGDVALADQAIKLGLQALTVNADLGAHGIVFEARMRSALATASAQGRIAPIGSGENARYGGASALEFTADAHVPRLAPLASLIDATMILSGEARARLQGRGTLARPEVMGPITVDRLAVALPAEGVDMKGGELRAVLTEREVRVDSFSIRGGEGVLTARGTLARARFDEAALNWRADKFMLLGRPDRRLIATGKGQAALKGGKLVLNGAIGIDEGLFELTDASLPAPGKDVVIAGRTKPKPAPRRTPAAAVDVSVDLGSNMQIRGRGLDTQLSGAVRLTTNARGEILAKGTLEAQRGTFAAYGQRLEIEQGTLYFNGPITNPGLDFLALRKRQAVEAGVAISGTLSQPLVRVVSDPPLPEGEALSWLVLGRSANQAGPGQLSALPLASSAIVGETGASIAKTLQLDEVGLRSGTGPAEQFLTVGKRITERLYVAFEQSLGGTANLLRLELTLTQRVTLRAQTGTTNSLGVFYRYTWD